MPNSYDAIVIGLGSMGSATVHELASRRVKTLGLDQFAPPHAFGSTHGKTRIMREAYFEDPCYVPLVRRAYERWAALEQESGEKLFLRTGGLMIGTEKGELVSGARRSAKEHRVRHQMLTAAEVKHLYPVFRLASDMVGLFEPRAGVLFPERCVRAFLSLAGQKGAALRYDERVTHWTADGSGIRVTTTRASYTAARLVITAGPWTRRLLPDLSLPLTVERQLFHWFRPTSDAEWFEPARCPIALWEYMPGRMFATFPDIEKQGVKIGVHHEGETTDPESVRRDISPEEDARVRQLLTRVLPAAAGALLDASVCLYTNMPDHNFLIDTHPAHHDVIIASPCSGHGFKFASAIGEILADMVVAGRTRFDIDAFRLGRGTRDGGREGTRK